MSANNCRSGFTLQRYIALAFAAAVFTMSSVASATVWPSIRVSTTGLYTDPVYFSCADSASSLSTPLTCSWSFGDGSIQQNATYPYHYYSSSGTYTATVTVCGDPGDCDSISQLFSLGTSSGGGVCIPVVYMGGPYSGVVGEQIPFLAADTNCEGVYFFWDFGDGTIMDNDGKGNFGRAAPHVYTSPGTYRVTMMIHVRGSFGASARAYASTMVPIREASSTQVQCQTDSSTLLTACVFERDPVNAQQHFDDFSVPVFPSFIAIGGGVEGADQPQGNLLTASYPSSDLTAWVVSTKDHVVPNPAIIKAYAIGIRVAGLTRSQLLQYMTVQTNTSDLVQHPDISVGIPAGFVMLGGGFRADSQGGQGNLATASFPDGDMVWHARSKDHQVVSPAYLTAYAVGMQSFIPGVGSLISSIESSDSGVAPHPTSSINVTPGYALTGCGADVHWTGAGNLLWKLVPQLPGAVGCTAGSKDHNVASPASITTYALGVMVQ